MAGSDLSFDASGSPPEELWQMDRFLDLVTGEIPRLRDDADGYGPQGKAFIPHVDIPPEVEEAYARVRKISQSNR